MLMHGLDCPGFVCEPAAIAFASRGFRPADDKPYNSIREIKDPESGLTLTLVEYPDGPSGDLSESVTTRIGAAVGDKVQARVSLARNGRDMSCAILKIYGEAECARICADAIIDALGIPSVFSEEALTQAEGVNARGVTEKDIAQIASWGMDHVRLPFDYSLIYAASFH